LIHGFKYFEEQKMESEMMKIIRKENRVTDILSEAVSLSLVKWCNLK
jgi:hypothetical protein